MYKAMDKATGEIVAVKIIPVCEEDNEDELKKIVREIDLLKKCDSPYVTAYYGSYFKNKRLWVPDSQCSVFVLDAFVFFSFFKLNTSLTLLTDIR